MIGFNTSHVTLYRKWKRNSEILFLFQYISCYSLSGWYKPCTSGSGVSIHLMLLFIRRRQDGRFIFITFQYISCYSLSKDLRSIQYIHCCFNTSHVTLYRNRNCSNAGPGLVSIHLMLLFIRQMQHYGWLRICVSIHLMLLFIPRFIGFSSSNSFYNTAKYKGLQDFYQPTSHFLFTHQNLGITPVFSIFFIFL